MISLNGKTAVITGAGSGIGRELALHLAREGCDLAIADINKQMLKETENMLADSGRDVSSHILDVSNRKKVYAFASDVINHHEKIDILINNAGVALQGRVEEISYENFEWILGINTWASVYTVKAFLPYLSKQPDAFIVNNSSLLGLIGAPTQSGYCMSKFALHGFTESIRMDIILSGLPVTVIEVHPGSIKTNIARSSRIENADEKRREKYVKRFDKSAKTSPEEAAAIIIKGIRKKKSRILIGSDAKIGDILQRLFPGSYYKFVLRNAVKMRKVK